MITRSLLSLSAAALLCGAPLLAAAESPEDQEARYEQALTLIYGKEKNEQEALKLIKDLARNGHAEAQMMLSKVYDTGSLGEEKNPKEALKWLLKSAKQGFARAQYLLGNCYLFGEVARMKGQDPKALSKEEIAKTERMAAKWYRKAAEQGGNERYMRGVEDAHAKKITRDAEYMWAIRDAQYWLGLFYAQGKCGLTQDTDEAVKWLRKAAEQGKSEAAQMLKEMGK